MAIWHQVAVTRLRASLVSDGYSNMSRDWNSAASATFLVKWSAQAVSEVIGDEPQTVNRIKLTGGPELALEAADRIVGPDGYTYEVDGEIMRSYGPDGGLHHVRAMLRRVTTGG